MKTQYFFIGLVVLSLTACGGSENPEEKKNDALTLSFTPTAGDKKEMMYEFEFDLPSKKTKVGFQCDLGLEVKSTENGKHEIRVTYDKICAKGNYADIQVNLCSGDSVKTELMRVVTPVFSYLNAIYSMQFDDRMRKTGEALISMDSTKGQAGLTSKMQFFTVLPDSAVSIGDSWEEDLDWSASNQKKARITYTYTKKEGNHAVFAFTGQLKTEGEGFGEAYTMTATLTGKIKVDVKTGWTVEAEMKQDVSVKVSDKPEETATYTYRMKMK